jgi:copper homeostasis protein
LAKITLEVCVDSLAGLDAAVQGGADRVELCQALGVGGLTPSIGMMRYAANAPLPVFAMIRPRAGSFVYSEVEVMTMLEDIAAARDSGLAGVVFGAMTTDGQLHRDHIERMIAQAASMGKTMHRVSDLLSEPHENWLNAAIELGFDRILTTGRSANVEGGLPVLESWSQYVMDHISIMPAGGLRPGNLANIVKRLRSTEVHSSCSSNRKLDMHGMRGDFGAETTTDANLVAEMKSILASIETS